MLKWLAILVIFASITPIDVRANSVPPGGNQANSDGAPNTPPPPASAARCEIKLDGTTIECQWTQAKAEGYWKRLFTAENTPDIALFFVGFVGIIVAIITLCKLERQTKATEDASKAALLQARHIESSERAWLSISSANKKESVLRPGAPPMYLWKIRNVGKTPARLIDTQAVCQITESVKLPSNPNFPARAIPLGERILGPGESLDFHAFWTTENGVLFKDPIETLGAIWLTAYGFVKYTTVFDAVVRESRFCDDFIDGSDIPVKAENPTRIVFRPHLDAPMAYTRCT